MVDGYKNEGQKSSKIINTVSYALKKGVTRVFVVYHQVCEYMYLC